MDTGLSPRRSGKKPSQPCALYCFRTTYKHTHTPLSDVSVVVYWQRQVQTLLLYACIYMFVSGHCINFVSFPLLQHLGKTSEIVG